MYSSRKSFRFRAKRESKEGEKSTFQGGGRFRLSGELEKVKAEKSVIQKKFSFQGVF